ncbi:hypothetical protein AVEN_182690-1 [Araneus ventricosus]|uniref:Uncharacterized protein n=1 Tax=Araneus ventricosus TaxID=182803 RepID=A0A4Y2XB58_ARAVE|nr:hypothetical protein AVEN_99261-1 [Araneus ventricosus]GBO46150.1 hypothetical protein AVEN_182690-1 [Araneus ventricosus]
MITFSPQREYITCVQFYRPQREIECKTAIAQSNPKNHTRSLPIPNLSVPLHRGDPRRFASLKSAIDRHTELCFITAKLSYLHLRSTNIINKKKKFHYSATKTERVMEPRIS